MFSRLRIYHAIVGSLAVTAYLSKDAGRLHVRVGYALAAFVGARLVIGVVYPRFVGKPHWFIRPRDLTFADGLRSPIVGKGILVGIMTCLLITISAGVALEQRANPKFVDGIVISAAHAEKRDGERQRTKSDKMLKEVHEAAANALFLFVFLHVGYLMVMRRQYALAMVFLGHLAKSRAFTAPR